MTANYTASTITIFLNMLNIIRRFFGQLSSFLIQKIHKIKKFKFHVTCSYIYELYKLCSYIYHWVTNSIYWVNNSMYWLYNSIYWVFTTQYFDRKWSNFTHFGTEGETIAMFRSASSRSWSRNDQGGWFGSGGGGRGMIWPQMGGSW